MSLKHRWSLGHNHLAGITLGKWVRLLSQTRGDIDLAYLHRVLFISLMSVNNSLWAGVERLRFGKRLAGTDVEEPPVFVLGHWRSGTTHLHNLLSLDDRFCTPNTYQVVNPYSFLSTEAMNTRLFGWLLPKHRPMDNMEMSFDAPQEDELGLCMMCLKSLYLGISFPRLEPEFRKYLTFREASPEDRESFLDALEYFIRKLTLKYHKPVILKSPSHTARVAMLLSRWPNARFIHVHRDPYTVFRSSQRYFDTATWYIYLQKPPRERVDAEILQRYQDLVGAFLEERTLIPPGQFCEVSYNELDAHPVQTMGGIYDALKLGEFDRVRPKIEAATQRLSGYQKNRHAPLPEELRQKIHSAWKVGFEAWDYPA